MVASTQYYIPTTRCGLNMIDKSAWSRLPTSCWGRNPLDDATIAVLGYTDGVIHTILHTSDKRTFIRGSSSKFHICGLDMIDKSAWSKLPKIYNGRNMLDGVVIAAVVYTDVSTQYSIPAIREHCSKEVGANSIYVSVFERHSGTM